MAGSKNNEESLLEAIKFYQSGLIRYMERNDDFKMSHGLSKLSSYPIRMSHLQDTGVGRTVNLLVKMDGKVGEQARSLIAKWKRMVEKEKEAQNDDSHSDDSQGSLEQHSDRESKQRDCESERLSSTRNCNSDDEPAKNKELDSSKENRGAKRHKSSRESESHKSGDHKIHDSKSSKRHKSSHKSRDEQSRHHQSKSEREHSQPEKATLSQLEERSPSHDKKHTSHREKEHSSQHEKKHSSQHGKEHSSKHEKSERSESKNESIKESSKKRDETSHKTKEKNNQEEKNKNINRREQRQKDSSNNSEKDSRSDKEKDKSSQREKNDDSRKERDDKYSKKVHGKYSNEKDKIKEVPAKGRENKKISTSAGNSTIEKISSSKHCKSEISSDSGTSFAEALGMLDVTRKEKKIYTKDNSSSKPSESVHQLGDISRNTEPKKEKKSDSIEKKVTSKHKKSEISSEASTSSGWKRKAEDEGPSTTRRKNELSSESGTSFEEALGMIGLPKKEKKSAKTRREVEENSNPSYAETDSPEFMTEMYSTRHSPFPVDAENSPPIVPLPSKPLEKIDVNVPLLPSITPNYRPIRIPDSSQSYNEKEFMDNFIKNKYHRTKIYAGNKSTYAKVPSLFDTCVQLLQLHIDAIEATGGVPYSILKPILEKATPSQLLRLEYYNSYLTEDSDELWKLHCQKDFRNKTRQECETWREMYNRCTDEREARLLTLAASIKESKEKSVPVRTTKLAYIDPPMAGSRRQVKNSAAPMAKAKVVALVRDSKASSDVVVSHQRKASRTPSAPSASSSQSKVKKMAPLMAKSMCAFKNRRYKN